MSLPWWVATLAFAVGVLLGWLVNRHGGRWRWPSVAVRADWAPPTDAQDWRNRRGRDHG